MKQRVRLVDMLHWQVKRCVNESRCKACSSEMTGSECPALVNDDVHQPLTHDDHKPLTYVAGVDISFVKNDMVNACAACVVMKLPEFDVGISVHALFAGPPQCGGQL